MPLAAQADGKTAAPATGPVLVLKTSQAEIASMVAMNLALEQEMPEAPEGGHYVLSLGADRKFQLATGTGDVGLLDLAGDPGALMDLFAEEVAGYKPMVQGSLTLLMQSQGATAKDVAAFTNSLFDLPKQMQRLTLVVTGDPEDPTVEGIDIKLGLEPKAGTGFANFASAMQPASQGAPMLAGGKNLMEMQFCLAPDSLALMSSPLLDWAISLTNQDEEQRKQAAAMTAQMMKSFDGGLSMAMDAKMKGWLLVGMQDGEKLREMVDSEAYQTLMKGQKMASRDVEMEVTLNAFEHRGAKVSKTKISGEPNPMMPDGTMESFFAAVGNYMTVSMGGGDANAKAVIDAVSDNKLKRTPIANGAVMSMVLDLHAMMVMTQPELADMDLEGQVPKAATVTFGKHGKGLQLHVHVQ